MYIGARLYKNVEVYADPELACDQGIAGCLGLGGYTNGNIHGQFSEGPSPYFSRAFVRIRIPVK